MVGRGTTMVFLSMMDDPLIIARNVFGVNMKILMMIIRLPHDATPKIVCVVAY
jgi:hypothetical protein